MSLANYKKLLISLYRIIISKYLKIYSNLLKLSYKSNQNSNPIYSKDSKGYIYIAFGKVFLKECILSAQSLKRFTNHPIHLFTDQRDFKDNQKRYFDSIDLVKGTHIRSKVDYISLSPFDKTIYLDTDIVVVYPIDELFDLLNISPLLGTLDFARKREILSKKIPEYKKIPYSFGEINGGLIAFNKNIKDKVLSKWPDIFYKYFNETDGWDQPSLRLLLWKYKVPVYILPPEYNIRSKKIIQKIKKSKSILGSEHMRPRIYHLHADSRIHNGFYENFTLEELEKIAKEDVYEIIY